jgi:hypothetical protein
MLARAGPLHWGSRGSCDRNSVNACMIGVCGRGCSGGSRRVAPGSLLSCKHRLHAATVRCVVRPTFAPYQEGLLTGHFDIAVHSLKDMPTQLPAGLCLAAITEVCDSIL